MIKTTLGGLPDAIGDILKEYDEYVRKLTPQSVRRVANKCRKTIRARASANFNGSDYASSWSTKVTEKGEHSFTITVYSKKPGLPHLLEHGHVIKTKSGKIRGRTDAKPHILPAEQEAKREIEKELKKIL